MKNRNDNVLWNLRDSGKILYITSIDISESKGPSINEREFMWALYKMFGQRVRFLMSEPVNEVPEILDYRTCLLRRIDYRRPYTFIDHNLSLYRMGMRLLDQESCDLIITRISLLPIGLSFLLKQSQIPLVIKHLGGYPKNFVNVQKGLKRIIAKFIAPLEEHIVKYLALRSIGIDCCTEEHISGVVQNLTKDTGKIILIDNATNTERFKPRDMKFARHECGLSEFDHIVGYVGGRPWERGALEMIKVAPRIVNEFPRVGFVIVGGGEGMDGLIREVEKSGLREHFVFTGIIPYDAVPTYINAFNVGIAFDSAVRLATVGNANQKIRQYIASGKPVITSYINNDFITKNQLGSIINPSSKDDLVKELRRWLLLKEPERKKHEDSAAVYAQKYLSVMKTLERRVDFWNKILIS